MTEARPTMREVSLAHDAYPGIATYTPAQMLEVLEELADLVALVDEHFEQDIRIDSRYKYARARVAA